MKASKILTAESCDIVLQNSSTGNAVETDSDSGDNIFITQQPVPVAKRPGKHQYSLMSSVATSKVDSSPSDANGESCITEIGNKMDPSLPKYIFPSILESHLLSRHNRSLCSFTIGGFFKCVKELWESGQRGDHLSSFLSTLDMNWEDISPLPENEDEMLERPEIKVVEKKHLVSKLKVIPTAQKRNQRAMEEMENYSCDERGACGEKKRKCGKRLSEMDNFSKDPLLVQAEKGTGHTRSTMTHRSGKAASFQKNELGEELSDSDNTVCYSLEPKNYQSKKKTGREESLCMPEPLAQTLLERPDAASVTTAKTIVLDGSKAQERKKKTNTKDDEEHTESSEMGSKAPCDKKLQKNRKTNKDSSWSQDILPKRCTTHSEKKTKKKRRQRKKRMDLL